MPNYTNGKIYAIRSPTCSQFYVNTTTNCLSKRLHQHKRNCSLELQQILNCGNSYIELIEYYPCNTKEELNRRLGFILRKLNEQYIINTQCINIFYMNQIQEFEELEIELEEIEF